MADELTIKVKAKLDEGSVSEMQTQLDNIGKNKKDGIKLQLDKSINTQINNLKKNLNQLSNKVYPIKIQIDQNAISNIQNLTDSLNKAIANVQNNISRSSANQAVGNIAGNGHYTGMTSYSVTRVDGTDVKEVEKYNDALGEQRTIIRDLQSEQQKETEIVTTNYEAKAKAREKAAKDEQKYQDDMTKLFVQARQKQAKEEARTEKEEQKAADYNLKFLSKQDIGIKDLESKAFNQNNPLTGDFKKTADDAVNYWKSKVDEAKTYSQKLTQDQENQIKEAEAAARRTVLEQQKAQWRGDKLAAKDVGQKVSNASWGLDIQVEELKQAGQYTEDVQNKIKALQDALKGVKDQKGFDEWNKQLQQFNQELELAGEKAKTAFKNDAMKLDIENLQTRLNNLKQKYDEFVEANPGKADAGIEETFKRISDAINSIDMNNVDPQKLALLRKEVRNFGADINGIVTPAQSLGQVLSQNLGGIGQYLARFTSTFYIISKGISTIKSMVNEVTQLDTSLMELQKVTTLSGDSLTQFTDEAYKTGKEVGRTGKDVIDAVTTFSRAGYNLQESNELAKAALTMTNVGVDIPNTEAAASDMISILRAYDKQANESMQVIDELYNVANKEPLDFGNITDMLVTAGGTLAQTNTSLEETMGLLTAGFATLRDNSVANG